METTATTIPTTTAAEFSVLMHHDPLYHEFLRPTFQGLTCQRMLDLIGVYDRYKGIYRKYIPGIRYSKGMRTLVTFCETVKQHNGSACAMLNTALPFYYQSWLVDILTARARDVVYSDMYVGAFIDASPVYAYSVLQHLAQRNLTNLIYMIIGSEFLSTYSCISSVERNVLLESQAYINVRRINMAYGLWLMGK